MVFKLIISYETIFEYFELSINTSKTWYLKRPNKVHIPFIMNYLLRNRKLKPISTSFTTTIDKIEVTNDHFTVHSNECLHNGIFSEGERGVLYLDFSTMAYLWEGSSVRRILVLLRFSLKTYHEIIDSYGLTSNQHYSKSN